MSVKYLHEANSRLDERFESQLTIRTEDALDTEGAQIYIRKIQGRLQWIRANVHGGGQEWQELTPHLAEDRLAGDGVGPVDADSLVKLRDMLTATQNPEAYEIGWYQDVEGVLYQFDGKTWVGVVPSKNKINSLEFLG